MTKLNTAGSGLVYSTFRGAATASAVAPVAPPPPTPGAPSLVSPANDARVSPGQPIVADWGDVAGAATYTIQIDDSSSFPAPVTVGETIALSQLATSSLPTTRM